MARITDHYGISGPVPFLDIDVSMDNRWFVDPHAIRLHGRSDRFARLANACADSFFDCVVHSVTTRDSPRGLHLLQQFAEPWETRLGLAKLGFHGHGGAQDVGSWMWQALTTDLKALVAIGLLRQLEDLPLFIEGIDKDITSDITTRIVYSALAEFTSAMCDLYPEFRQGHHRVTTCRSRAWDINTRDWLVGKFELPIADGKPLLLVPRGWARQNLLMSAPRYYNTKVLGYAQLERAVRRDDGKVIKTPKVQLQAAAGLERGRVTNLAVTHRAHEHNENLIADFKTFVDLKWTPPNYGQRIA